MSNPGKSFAQQKMEKFIKKSILSTIGSLVSGKGLFAAGVFFLALFIAILVMSVVQTVMSYIPSLSMPCIVGCGEKETSNISAIGKNEIPESYLQIYYDAENKYGVPWNILAAVHRVETVFSTLDPMVSPVGALGDMQFMPLTWVGWNYPGGGDELGNADIPEDVLTDPTKIALYGGYGVDADGDGRADPFDTMDAIFSAANYLSVSGGVPFDANKALYAYNHDQGYIDEVLSYAKRYADGFKVITPTQGASLPYQVMAQEWMNKIEWTDPVTGEKKVGLNSELRTQVYERDIRISPGMIMILAEKSGRSNKEKKAREFAEILAPRGLKVINAKKTTITVGRSRNGVSTNTTEEDMYFISEITTYQGVHKFTIGYEEESKVVSPHGGGSLESATTVTVKTPVVTGTQVEKSDELLDAALKKAHIRNKKGKLELLALTRTYDPNFFDERLMDQKDLLIFRNSEGRLQWPTPGFVSISSPFGYRKDPVTGKSGSLHEGMDIPAPVGTPVVASNDGKVIVAASSSVAGNYVKIDHGTMQTRYLHMKKLYVKKGDLVKRGQVIGESGNTGKSTGPHLHIEVIINNKAVDPYPYFKNKSGENK